MLEFTMEDVRKNNHQMLMNKLEEGAVKRELINVYWIPRGVGKSYSLAKFAEKNNIIAIYANRIILETLKSKGNIKYEHLYSLGDLEKVFNGLAKLGNMVVVDEGINIDALKEIIPDIEIVTGFRKL